MKTITTNFATPNVLVLLESTGKLLGILPVEAGATDISARIKEAIRDENECEDNDCIEFFSNIVVENNGERVGFIAIVSDDSEDDNPSTYHFELQTAVTY